MRVGGGGESRKMGRKYLERMTLKCRVVVLNIVVLLVNQSSIMYACEAVDSVKLLQTFAHLMFKICTLTVDYRCMRSYDTIEEFNVDSKAECDQLNPLTPTVAIWVQL